MRQFLVVTILLITASACFAQTTTPAADQAPATMPAGDIVTPSSLTGPTTPSVALGTASPSPVGASNATPGNQAGATNSTLQPTGTGGVASQMIYTTPILQNMPNPSAFSGNSINNPPADSRGLLVGGSDSAWAISNNTMGVAEAARLARAARASHKPRVFTNADLARLQGNVPVSVVGNTAPPVTNEQTMPASDIDEQVGPTTPVVPAQGVQQPANQNPPAGAPKSPFRAKPSPVQPR